MQKPQCSLCWLFGHFSRVVNFFFFFFFFVVAFFPKAGFRRSLNTRKPFKSNVIKWEKQSSLEKEICENISLYSQYFSHGAGSNVHK